MALLRQMIINLLLWLPSKFRSDEIYPLFWTRSSGSSIVEFDYNSTSRTVLKKAYTRHL